MRERLPLLAGVGLFVFAILSMSLFTVDQRQHALVFQLGEVKDQISDPGLHFKIPYVEEMTKVDVESVRKEGGKPYPIPAGCSEHPLVTPYDAHEVLGYVDSQSEVFPRPRGKYDDWPTSVINDKVPCSTCPFFPVCGGACPKRWYEGEKPCPIYVDELAFRFDILAEQNGYRVDEGSR